MTDQHALERAEARLLDDPSLSDRIAGKCRVLAGQVRRTHPRGYRHVDNVLDAGLHEASSVGRGPLQLLSVERLERRLDVLREEAEAEAARLARVAGDLADARRCELVAGGAVGVPHRDPALLDALRAASDRIEALRHRRATTEDSFGAVLDDADLAARALTSALGIARRSHRLRVSADAARGAAAIANAAALAA